MEIYFGRTVCLAVCLCISDRSSHRSFRIVSKQECMRVCCSSVVVSFGYMVAAHILLLSECIERQLVHRMHNGAQTLFAIYINSMPCRCITFFPSVAFNIRLLLLLLKEKKKKVDKQKQLTLCGRQWQARTLTASTGESIQQYYKIIIIK